MSLELFPEVNPNLDEVAEEGGNIKVEIQETKRLKQNEIFDLKKNIKKELKQTRPVVKTEVSELIGDENGTQAVIPPPGMQGNSPSSKYPHLKAARAKGIITRKEKAKIRKEQKAEAKRLKDIEKQERRDATKERNRVKARERYRRLKAEKETKPLDIPKRKPQYIPNAEKDMSFKQFSNYMMRYEEMKGHYKNYKNKKIQQNKEIEKNQKILQQKPKKEFPDNYPLSHIYGKNRFKPTDFNNF